ETVGITSGASAPEELVERLVELFRERGAEDVSELRTVHEDVRFMLPKGIREVSSSAASGEGGQGPPPADQGRPHQAAILSIAPPERVPALPMGCPGRS